MRFTQFNKNTSKPRLYLVEILKYGFSFFRKRMKTPLERSLLLIPRHHVRSESPFNCRTSVDRHFTSWQEPRRTSLTASQSDQCYQNDAVTVSSHCPVKFIFCRQLQSSWSQARGDTELRVATQQIVDSRVFYATYQIAKIATNQFFFSGHPRYCT